MSSTVLKWAIAALIMTGALLLWLSLQMVSEKSTGDREGPESASVSRDEFATKAVIATSPISADSVIESSDVSLEPVSIAPANGFETPQRVVGRQVSSSIGVGEPVVQHHFRRGGELASELPEGTRAVSVPVNEVSGVGGFVEPGDRVDLGLFLPSGNEVDSSQAQILLKDVVVLAFGQRAARGEKQQEGEVPNPEASNAVLAVPDESVARVLLGASTGRVTLLLRPGKPRRASDGQADGDGSMSLSRLAEGEREGETLRDLSGQQRSEPRPRTRVHRGSETEEVVH
ncbi:Flp pilus assembly protein CpaB [uncultured Halovibrio sp.]|uniref:Flp pilus assembly protein CpaB n=1 Tax=uncultured Halovibrio sp. TaxID=985049 RepID=UPI0025E2DC6A|nr:Flp pilus assembly protein CpaB [uncultured Halovibrio sp.]